MYLVSYSHCCTVLDTWDGAKPCELSFRRVTKGDVQLLPLSEMDNRIAAVAVIPYPPGEASYKTMPIPHDD